MPEAYPGIPPLHVPVWSQALRAEYAAFVSNVKKLSTNSINSYCWRVETLLKALTNSKGVVVPIRTKQELKNLLETNMEEARALVRQDDRQSHFDLLRQMLDMTIEVRPAGNAMGLEDLGVGMAGDGKADPFLLKGAKVGGNRDKVWDASVRQNYRIWLRGRGTKDRTCGSYCTYVHNLLRVLLDKDNEQRAAVAAAASGGEGGSGAGPSSAGGAGAFVPRTGGLNKEELVELLTAHAAEARAQVMRSKKQRYLKSFRTFLGIIKEDLRPRLPKLWYDRFGLEYKHWLSRNGMVENGKARKRGYLGAARAMLRVVRKQGWVTEAATQAGGLVTRAMVATAIQDHRTELGEACSTADTERVGAFMEYLQASDEEVAKLPLDQFSCGDSGGEDDEDDDEDGEGEGEEEDGTIMSTEASEACSGAAAAASGGASKVSGSVASQKASSQVTLLQKRVRELESMCAEKDRECEAHRAKVVRLEQELQHLRGLPTSLSDALTPPAPGSAIIVSQPQTLQSQAPGESAEVARLREEYTQLQAAYTALLDTVNSQQTLGTEQPMSTEPAPLHANF